jgi:predicted O-methyltransferase YrrM
MSVEKASKLPRVLLEAFNTRKVITRDGRKLPLHSNISQEEAERLYEIVTHLTPETSVEVGLATGISTIAILQALTDARCGTHHVIDPFQAQWEDVGLATVERAELGERFQFYRDFPENVIPKLGPIQFAFIDASHLFDLTLLEFILADKKLVIGGVVGFHDVWMSATQRIVRFILRNRKYELLHPPKSTTLRQKIGGILQNLPYSEQIFSQNILRPIEVRCHGNLILLRKRNEDKRDIRDYWEF